MQDGCSMLFTIFHPKIPAMLEKPRTQDPQKKVCRAMLSTRNVFDVIIVLISVVETMVDVWAPWSEAARGGGVDTIGLLSL